MNRRDFLLAAAMTALTSPVRAELAPQPGKMLVTGFRGTKPGDPEVERVAKFLDAGLCAGVILLRRNCTSPEQISRLSRSFRDAAGELAPIISIDQEGGKVARLGSDNGFLDWMSARAIVKSGMSDEEIRTYWTERAWQLSEVGINVNFAPVVDLDINPDNPIIAQLGRSFGSDPDQVSRMAAVFITAHKAAGIKTSLKHFPGHGSSATDSHKETADISNSWQSTELVPYSNLIEAGLAESVMNGHLLHNEFSDEPWLPTSLSWRSVKNIRKLGFQGVIFTDDMQMAAIEEILPPESAAVAAVNAGNTFLIYSNYRKSDEIDTVGRIAASLTRDMDKMSPESVALQVALADQFRSTLR